ncbi:MAG: homocysteine S-methyltransferase family protein, partial [Clostridia bacterium]|nr:homocysteine S-methyltransferase family protein [Clostridia bacterium]
MNQSSIIYLDGAMGTMLQRAGLKTGEKPEVFGMLHPDVVCRIHERYIEAGSDVIYTNTFGANARKYAGSGYSVSDVIAANVATAKDAAKKAAAQGRKVRVALDAGPLGELMEPLGTLSFEEAYDCFREVVIAGEAAGADLVIFETMTDLAEVRAAVLAAKENSSLPVWVTMTFEKNGRTFTGTDAAAMALTLDGLGVDALGVNCSLGPEDLVPIVKRILERTNLPVIVKPNAGLPDPRTGLYAMTPERFAGEMSVYPAMGIHILGGCCGTQPSFISSLKERCDGWCTQRPGSDVLKGDGQNGFSESSAQLPGQTARPLRNGVCSAGRVTDLNGHVRVIGERINPTGKKRFQQALREHDMNYVMKCAIEQTEAGADILDINTGLPGADEVSLMRDVVRAVQSVTDLPLQIDSSTPAALEAGLRAANGRVIVNSVNAEEEKCRQILPLVKKYGACVIGLALKKSGMPQNARERIENVEAILRMTDEYGIPRSDVIIDCLALTVSAQQEQAMETLHAAEYVSRNFGVHCTLGVSNISFGLPQRKYATVSFLTQAMYCGVDLP